MDDLTQPTTNPSGPLPAADAASQAGPWEADLTGKVLGDFHVLRRIGQGGMGQVYLAEQTSLKRKVALKLLRPDLAANARALERFVREAKAIARATHASIVQVYAIGEADGTHYMALEYVEGRNLREHLEKKGLPPLPEALSVLAQVASALQKASELGIVHRDVKPENILITREMEVKVADFGLSRIFEEDGPRLPNLTESGVTMGTPLYMSPEQVEGKGVDPRSDIYSLGATCYHMFAGHPPFRGQTPFEVAIQHVQKEPQPLGEIRPDLPAEVCALVHRMMAKQPSARFQTAREVLREVARLRGALGISGELHASLVSLGPAPTGPVDAVPTQSMPRLRLRRWLPWAVALTLLLAVAAGAALGWRHYRDAALPELPLDEGGNLKPVPGARKQREEFLVQAMQQHANPETPRDVRRALEDATDLGLFYLQERRLDDADRFFKELARPDQKFKGYRYLGALGEAMVLAFRDEPRQSNELFVRLLVDRGGEKMPGTRLFWMSNPQLREMTARALHHNHVNAPEAFPKALEPWRFPPAPAGKGPAKPG